MKKSLNHPRYGKSLFLSGKKYSGLKNVPKFPYIIQHIKVPYITSFQMNWIFWKKIYWLWVIMQISWHWWVKISKISYLSKNVHHFFKNCKQAILPCFRLYSCLNHPWNTCESSLKQPLNFLETSLKLPWNTIETSNTL